MKPERRATLPPAKLTPAVVAAAALPPGRRQVVLRDPTRPGFLLVVSMGSKSYAIQRHLKRGPGLKETVRKTIGTTDKVSLQEAWKRAKKLLQQIEDGEDPRFGERVKGEPTLGDAWKAHIAWLKDGNGTAATVYEYEKVLDRHFADWKATPIRTFGAQPDLLRERQGKINKIAPNAASTPMRRFSAVYAAFRKRNHHLRLPENPIATLYLKEYERRQDHLTPAQLKEWWKRVQTLENAVRRDFHIVSLFTGCRPNVLHAARVSDFNEKGYIHFPKMKSGREFDQPLPKVAVEIIRQRIKDNKDGEWIFPSDTSDSGHIEENDDKELRMRGSKGDVHCWTGYWLRRNFASHARAAGVPKADISKLLDHKEGGVTAGYIDDPVSLGYMLGRIEQVANVLLAEVGR